MENMLLILFFFSFAVGLVVSIIPGLSKIGQYTCVMLCSLIIGIFMSVFNFIDFPALNATINSMKSLLFLLFIFATGYICGPSVYPIFRFLYSAVFKRERQKKNKRKKGSGKVLQSLLVPVCVAVSALVVIWIVYMFRIHDKRLLGAIAAGALTQTAILGMTSSVGGGDYSSGITPEVVFTLTYILSTVATILYCSWCIPLLSLLNLFRRNQPQKPSASSANQPRFKKPEVILSDSAGVLKGTGGKNNKAISFKFLPVPDRVGRAFIARNDMRLNKLCNDLAPHQVTIQGILEHKTFKVVPEYKTDTIRKGAVVFVLGARSKMKTVANLVGDEKIDIPSDWQKYFHYSSLSIFLLKPARRQDVVELCNEHNMCIEQIISVDNEDLSNSGIKELEEGTKIKLFGKKKDMETISAELNRKILEFERTRKGGARLFHKLLPEKYIPSGCFLIPKDKSTGIALISFCIAFALALSSLFPLLGYVGSGCLAFFFGIFIGSLREACPSKIFGFPPQASNLFQTFGLGGYLVLSGLAASGPTSVIIKNLLSSDVETRTSSLGAIGAALGPVLLYAFLIWFIPLLSGTILAFWIFKNNAIESATSVAGSRSSNVAYAEIMKHGSQAKAQLESIFVISYSIANILLTLIGTLIVSNLFPGE